MSSTFSLINVSLSSPPTEMCFIILKLTSIEWKEKRMFGGVCFMVDDKMLCGTFRDGLMVRVNPEDASELLGREFTEQLMQKDKPMNGFLLIQRL